MHWAGAGHSGHGSLPSGQVIYAELQAGRQWARATNAAALRIHKQGVAVLGEIRFRIEAGNPYWNLRANSRSKPPLGLVAGERSHIG
jgi:hypothetical protein